MRSSRPFENRKGWGSPQSSLVMEKLCRLVNIGKSLSRCLVVQYRQRDKYHLHEFVVMPDHFHLLITPTETLERALQLIKGGFSFRAKKELGFGSAIWQKSFYDRRVRDIDEYCAYREYIHRNPVKRRLVRVVADYPYTSARQVPHR